MTQHARRADRRFGAALALIGLVGLAVRVIYIVVVADDIPTVGDARTYHLLAANLADGAGYIRPLDYLKLGRAIPSAEFPPLFPALLSVGARAGLESVIEQKLLMATIGTGTVVLIGFLGRMAVGATVGLAAAGLAAAYPMLFQPDGALMPETLYAFLVTIALIGVYRAAANDDLRLWGVTGLVLGLATLVRAEALLLAPLFVLGLALHRRPPWRRWFVTAGVLAAGAVVVIAPWTIRNAVRLEHFIPVSSNFGGLVLGANCPETYEGKYLGLWRYDCYDRVDYLALEESERSQAFLKEGVEYASSRPGRAVAVAGVRFLRIWGVWDVKDQIDWESFEGRTVRWQTIGHRMYLLLIVAAVPGLVSLLRRNAQLWPLLATAVMVSVTGVLSYGNQRFRIAAEPALLVVAATGLVAGCREIAERARARRTA